MKKGIRGETCHAIYRDVKANDKYMKDYDKNKELSYLKCWDVNNSYSWEISRKLPVNNFEWIEDTIQFIEDFIKNFNEKVRKNIFSKLMFKLHQLHNDLPFLPEKVKIKKFEKLVTNLHDKTEYIMDMRNLKQSLNY